MRKRLNFQNGEVLMAERLAAMEEGAIAASVLAPVINGYSTGCSNWPVLDTDLTHIICYGQSLSSGSSSVACGDAPVEGVYVLGDIVRSSGSTLTPLYLTSGTQHPIANAANVLATLIHQHCGRSLDFIVGSYGAGGQSIAQLMSSTR